jgi:hypothetical protein
MTNSDPDSFPVLDQRCLPRNGAEIYLANEQIELFNLCLSATPEIKKQAKNRLLYLATDGPPFGMHLLRLLEWYERHPEVRPEPLNLRELPRPPALPRRQSSSDPPADTSGYWDFK